MRRDSPFWGVILILCGALLLLSNLDVIDVAIWSLAWPVLLVALGVSILWRVLRGPWPVETEEAVIPLEGAARARVRVQHGAGRLRLDAGAGPGLLAAGTFGGGLDYRAKWDRDVLDVEMRLRAARFVHFAIPWVWRPGRTLDWSFGLNREIPLSLDLRTGASDTRLNLSALLVTDLRLETGASATDVTLPTEAGHTRVGIHAGAASVTIRVPSSVAARIRARGSLASVNVDGSRFPRLGRVYQSPDYAAAPNKVEIEIEAAVGSIAVR